MFIGNGEYSEMKDLSKGYMKEKLLVSVETRINLVFALQNNS